jgi:hypothetical protein
LIRKERGNDQSEAPIYMRITIAGERFELSTRRATLPENWSVDLDELVEQHRKRRRSTLFSTHFFPELTGVKNKF